MLIPLSKDAVGVFGAALEVGVDGAAVTWSGEDAEMSEIGQVVGRQLKQEERRE